MIIEAYFGLVGKTRSFDHPSPEYDKLFKHQIPMSFALSIRIGPNWSRGPFFPVVYGSMVELWGNIPIFPGSQEVIASIPICSTQIIKGLQTRRFADLSLCAHKMCAQTLNLSQTQLYTLKHISTFRKSSSALFLFDGCGRIDPGCF